MPPSTGYSTATITNPGSALTNFPLLIDLSQQPSSWWSEVDTSDGTRGRAFKDDGTTELAIDWINFDNVAETGWARVLWSGTLASTGTQVIRIYPPNTGNTAVAASATFGSDNAYPSHLLQYLPLDGDANDRTSNANNGTLNSLAFPTDEIVGQVGSGLQLDGSGAGSSGTGDFIDGVPAALRGAEDFTFLAWIKAEAQSTSAEDTIVSNWTVGGGTYLGRYNSDTNVLDMFVNDGTDKSVNDSVSIEGSWHHWAGRLDGASIRHFLDGAVLSDTEDTIGDTVVGNDQSVWGTSTHNDPDGWFGGLDELQAHNIALSNDWIKQEYDQSSNQTTFWGSWTWNAASSGTTNKSIGMGFGGGIIGG